MNHYKVTIGPGEGRRFANTFILTANTDVLARSVIKQAYPGTAFILTRLASQNVSAKKVGSKSFNQRAANAAAALASE